MREMSNSDLTLILSSENEGTLAGLGIATAAIFLAGEMAGSGVLALAYSVVQIGIPGLVLIVMFAFNSSYIGSRLGLCWEVLAEKHKEFRDPHVRDPYPLIAEKAGLEKGKNVSRILRLVAVACVILTLYGAAIVFIELIAEFMFSLSNNSMTMCIWMMVVVAVLTPITWLGAPKDFWPLAIGALITTITACTLCNIQIVLDTKNNKIDFSQCSTNYNHSKDTSFVVKYPNPSFEGYFMAFGSIMFAFGGASTFPTIQADMKDKSKFKFAAYIAMAVLFAIYFPTAFVGYYFLGDCVQDNMISSMSDGIMKKVAEGVMMTHLITAVPIVINPPSQYFEEIMDIPKSFNWKRILFRTCTMIVVLLIGQTLPSFGAILSLIGGSTVTIITFILPPILYMLAVDGSDSRKLGVVERIYCYCLIFIGVLGGISATYSAISAIAHAKFDLPCYLQ